jgi:hypothetical protein
VHDGLIQLSKKHEGRSTKPVVKLIFDRGNPKQVIKNHQRVLAAGWEALAIPLESEIPNLHLEVMVRLHDLWRCNGSIESQSRTTIGL